MAATIPARADRARSSRSVMGRDDIKLISFPRGEWDDIRARLDRGKTVWTIRVGDEYGKFRTGDVVRTEWGSDARITSVKNIKGGLVALKDAYTFFDELTERMRDDLRGYDEMEIVTLVQTE